MHEEDKHTLHTVIEQKPNKAGSMRQFLTNKFQVLRISTSKTVDRRTKRERENRQRHNVNR